MYYRHLPVETNIVLSGFSPAGFTVDMSEMQKAGLGIMTVCGWSLERNEATLALMASGKVQVEPLITHTAKPVEAGLIYEMIWKKSAPFLMVNFAWE
jgi:threonine dehydrogenase-like Zn-dependent dehydrogenase